MKITNKIKEAFLNEKYSMEHRFLNVLLAMMFISGMVCFVLSLVYELDLITSLLIAAVDVLLVPAFYLSAFKGKKLAAIIIVCAVDIVIPVLLYFKSGGMQGGVPLWFVATLVVFWFVLKSPYCYIMYAVHAVITVGCFVTELNHPEFVENVETGTIAAVDIIKSMLVVALLIGIVFRYQSYLYNKQRNDFTQQTIELRETMLALERANEAKNQFLTNMSHEIRTPINAIMGMNEIILRESDSESISQYAKSIQGASKLLLDCVNNVLDFSKIESGLMEIETFTYKTEDLLGSISRIIEPKINKKGIEFRLSVDENIPEYLMGDNYKISRVVTHLMTNAIKYTDSGYVALTLDCKKKDDSSINLVISVADTGTGIPEEELNELFGGFKRIDLNKHRNIEGLGLGLAVTKRLVELMGGTIDAKSVYGSGSMFTLTIPQGIGDAKMHEEKAEETEGARFTAPKAKILAVDDNKLNLEVIKHLLKKYDITIDMATGGEDCIKLCSNKCYDLIFMDHMMPAPDGIETLEILHSDGNLNQNTPIMVVTANAINGAREEYLKAGFAEYLSKPIDVRELEAALKKILQPELVEQVSADSTEKKDVKASGQSDGWIVKDAGLRYFSYDEDIYYDVLSGYCEQMSKYRSELVELVEKSAWEDYAIIVHSVKSNSLNIGSTKFSSMAKEQEIFAKTKNADKIHETFEAFMKAFDEVHEEAKRMCEAE